MRKIIVSLLLILACMSVYATPIKQIVFFGDSLSDDGNLYSSTFKLVPKSPPYYQGRFSNGPTWAERVGRYFYEKDGIAYKNYAVGSATSIFHAPTSKAIALSTLGLQVDEYLVLSVFRDKSNVLYAIWIGANDYLNVTDTDANELTDSVIGNIAWALNTLIDKGATNFLVINLPDLALTPRGQDSSAELKQRYSLLARMHNAKLAKLVNGIKGANSNVTISFIDTFTTLNEVIANPAIYNQKYNINITDTKTSCWGGGYIWKAALAQQNIAADLRQTFKEENGNVPATIDFTALSQAVTATPSLQAAYETAKLSEKGIKPCVNPNEHVFWDKIHPTQTVHYVLGQIAIDTLSKEIIK